MSDPFKDKLLDRIRRPSALTLGLVGAVLLGVAWNFYQLHLAKLPKEAELHTVEGIAAALEARHLEKALVRTRDKAGRFHSFGISYDDVRQCKDGQRIVVLNSGSHRSLARNPCDPEVVSNVE